VPRKDWVLCVPYQDGETSRPMFPDFLLVRDEGSKLVVDIIDLIVGHDAYVSLRERGIAFDPPGGIRRSAAGS
jgi:hypothetical protein